MNFIMLSLICFAMTEFSAYAMENQDKKRRVSLYDTMTGNTGNKRQKLHRTSFQMTDAQAIMLADAQKIADSQTATIQKEKELARARGTREVSCDNSNSTKRDEALQYATNEYKNPEVDPKTRMHYCTLFGGNETTKKIHRRVLHKTTPSSYREKQCKLKYNRSVYGPYSDPVDLGVQGRFVRGFTSKTLDTESDYGTPLPHKDVYVGDLVEEKLDLTTLDLNVTPMLFLPYDIQTKPVPLARTYSHSPYAHLYDSKRMADILKSNSLKG